MADFSFDLEDIDTSAAEAEAVGGTYTHNLSHAAEAIGLLIQFFREGPRNQAVMRAIGNQTQEAENAFDAMLSAFNLDTAEGDQLDLLGKIVDERRAGRSDADYRAGVLVRILVNRSDGTLPQLIEIAEGINSAATILAREMYPAGAAIEFDSHGSASFSTVALLLEEAKPAGVRLNVTTGFGSFAVGAADGSPAGGVIGAADGDPAGLVIGSGS